MKMTRTGWHSKLSIVLSLWIFANANIVIATTLTLDDIFPTDRVLDIQISVAEKDWDTIRHQTRTFGSALDIRRKTAPIESPYHLRQRQRDDRWHQFSERWTSQEGFSRITERLSTVIKNQTQSR